MRFRNKSLFKAQFVLKRVWRIWKRLFPELYFGTITELSLIERLKELTDSLFLHSNGKLFHSLTVEGKKEL